MSTSMVTRLAFTQRLMIMSMERNSDVSFLDLYLQNYVKDEKKHGECIRVINKVIDQTP